MKFSGRLRSRWDRFKISKKSLKILEDAGVRSIWYHHTGYAYAKCHGYQSALHRLLLEAMGRDLAGLEVDHINGNTLDNRLCNLRVVTKKQNSFNVKRPINNTSGFKGVSFHKHNARWVAYIGKYPREYLGSFGTAIDAARAYNTAAKKRYGKFAKLNCI
jgi:hypothetical protein